MKITSKKQHIICGRMPVVLMVRMKNSGLWLSSSFLPAHAKNHAARNQAQRPARHLKRRQLKVLRNHQAKNNIGISCINVLQ